MERLLQTFETPFTARGGEIYDVHLYGQGRPGDTWQGWLVFTRRADGQTFTTDSETTQPSEAAVLYWAAGLTFTYLEGALDRAQWRARKPADAGDTVHVDPLSSLEHAILLSFSRRGTTHLSTDTLLRDLPQSSADVMRAVKELQTRRRLLLRKTEMGQDWLILTDQGVRAIAE